MKRVREAWVFDLDNTLYPADNTIYDAIGDKMTAYVARAAGLDLAAGEKLREHYFLTYGATVVGLVRHHGVDAADFMADVHDVDMSVVKPDLPLNDLIAALPGRRIVFTNGGADYARRMIKQLALEAHFETIVDLESTGLIPKPEMGAYTHLVEACALDPGRTMLIEDTLRNLEPAHALGFETALVGPVHPAPRPAYLDHTAHDVKALLRELLDCLPA